VADSDPQSDPVAQFEQVLEQVARDYRGAFEAAADEHALRAVNARIAGPQGALTQVLKLMPRLPKDGRRALGQRANALKGEVQGAFDASLERLQRAAREAELSGPPLDVTLPGRGLRPGRTHPVARVADELLDIFTSLGFDVADGPEIELHEYNFDRLGFPPDHPATDMQDTFFVSTDAADPKAHTLLRTHTSPIQVREMLRRPPPLALVAPGVVYRRDDDVTHSPMFFQVEGLLVDENVSFADLKGVLTLFVQRLFGPEVPVRFRPSYFPFVEPGGEVDMGCTICRPWERRSEEGGSDRTERPKVATPSASDASARGESEGPPSGRKAAGEGGSDRINCKVCKSTGWLEVLGCGMVHPVVFESVGYDPERWTGFAFGLGVDRIAMLRYGIDNIRLLYENDVRLLSQL
jgi:phenylalanyl-tRNA synthetase alpha chain